MHPAKRTAVETAKLNRLDEATPRMIDTDYAKRFPCYQVIPGIVVYEDEPDCVCSVEAREGRFIPA